MNDEEIDLKIGAISEEVDHMITEVENAIYLKKGAERARKF